MALSATIYNFDTELADIDRGVYQSLALRIARHPSETAEFMLTRLLRTASSTKKALNSPKAYRRATILRSSCGT